MLIDSIFTADVLLLGSDSRRPTDPTHRHSPRSRRASLSKLSPPSYTAPLNARVSPRVPPHLLHPRRLLGRLARCSRCMATV